ncbi:hypothetical protein B0H19DRAFT_489444 [Mycena capillaripes]|nr:hypothetical protein B0H19DRAFT_489444 [Mycena capillaripes]
MVLIFCLVARLIFFFRLGTTGVILCPSHHIIGYFKQPRVLVGSRANSSQFMSSFFLFFPFAPSRLLFFSPENHRFILHPRAVGLIIAPSMADSYRAPVSSIQFVRLLLEYR